ncbi:MAG TPA: type II toxin-antitoxin system VapC family toxin [Planctomycetota bacterium]|nr:type II toxin-antitoxin system VapC family toxin [Planctomycetota bacterium]
MTVLVLDASVTLSWCFPDRRTPFTTHVLHEIADGFAVVPGLWALEVGNALAASERKGYLEPADIASFLGDLEELPKRVEHQPPERALGRVLDLARSHKLSTYDACYLELAERLALPLATLDELAAE